MTKVEYFNTRQKLIREHGEHSVQVRDLDTLRESQLNAGNSNLIDASNQSNQGGTDTAYVSGEGLSDSAIAELGWMQQRMQKKAVLEQLANGIADVKAEHPDFYNEDGTKR